jgi:dephospho-CoA kinase
MPSLLGVTGHSGAGKTTAIMYLVKTCGADRIYVGQLITDEVARLGMPPGSASETTVREELRQRDGMEAFAVLVEPAVRCSLALGKSVIIDAVSCMQEMEYYRQTFDQSAPLVSVLTPFDARASRVANRTEKPMTAEELRARDAFENAFLRTDLAISAASIALCNDGDLSGLYQSLDEQVCHLVA